MPRSSRNRGGPRSCTSSRCDQLERDGLVDPVEPLLGERHHLPLIRARKSHGLICRSEAPRSTAALMIFSMNVRHSRGNPGSAVLPHSVEYCRFAAGRKKPHPVPHLPHRLGSTPASRRGAVRQDLVYPVRVFLEL